MQLTHIGHACVLVEVAGARLLIDPGTFASGWESVGDLDAVLITHTHPDHCDRDRLPALLAANEGVRVAAEPSVAAELAEAELPVQPFAAGDDVDVGGARITGIGGRHAVIHADIPRVGNVGMLVQAEGEPTLFHPGDAYQATPADVDLLAVPLNAPWSAFKETVEFTRAVAPRIAFPIHDGLLNETGRALYLRQLTSLGETDVRDLAGGAAHELT